MKTVEFVKLVRRMRSQQTLFRSLTMTDVEKKAKAMIRMKQLEKEVDDAEIDDIHNLVTESPIA